MTPASIELDELQLVPYRAPPMLVLTCATARDASYWRVAELTRRSIASFICATGSRETTRRGQHARCQAKSGIAYFSRIFKIMIEFKILAIVLVEPAHFG